MTPLKQRFYHNPEKGEYGDCHRAAIASILNLSLDEVPNFGHELPNGDEFSRRANEFLAKYNLIEIAIPYVAESLQDILDTIGKLNPNIYYLIGGMSKSDVNHTVVGLGNEIVHDPSRNDSGIVGPCADGFYWITYFGALLSVDKT